MDAAIALHLRRPTSPHHQSDTNSSSNNQVRTMKNPAAIEAAVFQCGNKSTLLATGENVPFPKAIGELMEIFYDDEVELSNTISRFVVSGDITGADKHLYAWSTKYHNAGLQPAPDQEYSISVVRNGLLESLRKSEFNTDSGVLTRAYFEAHNARVISERAGDGSLPAWSFVDANLAIRCLRALIQSGFDLSKEANAFMGLDLPPELQSHCIQLQREIQKKALTNDIALKAESLAGQKLCFDYIADDESLIDKMLVNEKQLEKVVCSFKANTFFRLTVSATISDLTVALTDFNTQLFNLCKQLDEFQFLMVRWCVAENIGKLKLAIDIALKSIEELPEYERVSDEFNQSLEKMLYIRDILELNQTGYPIELYADERDAVPELERLFRQSTLNQQYSG